jgi:DNA/RNA-binding domain of Phe-tRNA-synthetase-like protein
MADARCGRHNPDAMEIRVAPHPRLRAAAFLTRYPVALEALPVPADLRERLRLDAPAPVVRSEALRAAVRDLLRHGGYKPTGRGKPSSEYLVRAAGEGALGSINVAVDACNAVSLATGWPISVVDLERARQPLSIAIAEPGTRYVFNASGQEIDVGGLLCLFDAEGPCANAVKDSQRTKTGPATRETVSVLWGCVGHEEHLGRSVAWYRELLAAAGAETEDVDLTGG